MDDAFGWYHMLGSQPGDLQGQTGLRPGAWSFPTEEHDPTDDHRNRARRVQIQG